MFLPDDFLSPELWRDELHRFVHARRSVHLHLVHRAHLHVALTALRPIGRLQEVEQGPPDAELTLVRDTKQLCVNTTGE